MQQANHIAPNNTCAPIVTPEELATWEPHTDPRMREFAGPLYDTAMQTVAAYLAACTAENFSDDDTDGNTVAADLISTVTHLYYEATPEELSYFLFDTSSDEPPNTVHLYSINDMAAGVGPLYYEPLASYLKHYTDRIEEAQNAEDAS